MVKALSSMPSSETPEPLLCFESPRFLHATLQRTRSEAVIYTQSHSLRPLHSSLAGGATDKLCVTSDQLAIWDAGCSGTDIDALAVESATNNVKLNQLSDRFACTICEMDGVIRHDAIDKRMTQGQYDVVIANILLPPLLALVHRLSAAVRPGGKLCLSGATRHLGVLVPVHASER